MVVTMNMKKLLMGSLAFAAIGASQMIFSYNRATLEFVKKHKTLPDVGVVGRNDLSFASLAGVDFSGAKLSGANFNGADLRGANFSRAELVSSNFSGASLENSIFDDANCYGANFNDAFMDRASFKGAEMANANLSNVSLKNADLSNANLSGSRISCKYARGETYESINIKMTGADFAGANIIHFPFNVDSFERKQCYLRENGALNSHMARAS